MTTSAALAAAGLLDDLWAQPPKSANDKVQVGIIGHGIMGSGDGETASSLPGVKVVAVADIYEGRLTNAKETYGADTFTTRDYRELLARPGIDAVIIATPDHWHATITIAALKAGKDVYCQKPMVQKLPDGLDVVKAEKDSGRILQVGSQGLSGVIHAKARDLIRAGAIGEVNMIETNEDRFSKIGAWQYVIPPDASLQTVDWETFLGKAPKRPFEPIRLFRWRNYRDYGTGVAGDLFVHQFTSIHFVMDTLGPELVLGTGGIHYWNDGRDVPDVMTGLMTYPKTAKHPEFHVSTKVNFVAGGGPGPRGFRFIGSEGQLIMEGDRAITLTKRGLQGDTRYDLDPLPKAMREKLQAEIPPVDLSKVSQNAETRFTAPAGYSTQTVHHMNWIKSIRTRQTPVENASYGLRAAAPPLLANISHFEQRACRWDPVNMVERKTS